MLKTETLKKPWFIAVAAGAGFYLLIFLSTVFVMTRPCAVGKCKEISQAKKLAERSQAILQQPRSEKEIIAARQHLEESLELLESIPQWSYHSVRAEKLLKLYQFRKEKIENLVTGLELGKKAVYLTVKSPLPVSQLLEIKQIWTKAIAALEKIPNKSEFHSFASLKINQYQQNLDTTNEQLRIENKALENLASAKKYAQIAQTNQNKAQYFKDWDLVFSNWQTVVINLEQIPQTTTVYEEARQLLENLEPQINSAGEYREIEQLATNNYNEAIRIAKLAKDAEGNKRWSEAVYYWRNALNYLEKVPQNTFQYRKAKPAIAPYEYALDRAQFQLHVALRLKQAGKDLEKTCSQDTIVCNYTINEDAIKVHLTSDYMGQVQQTALQAKQAEDIRGQVNVIEHIFSLETALKTITNNAGVRVEIYNSEDTLILTYAPRK